MNKRLMLDSGAFSAMTRKETIDIDEYMQFIKEYEDYIDSYINLDVVPDTDTKEKAATDKQSYENWEYMRSKGFNSIPVFHAGSDFKYLEKYLKKTNWIALGAISTTQTKQRFHWLDMIWNKYLTDKKGMPICRVHAMGLSAIPMMFRYPWYSMDSTAFVKSAAYGKLYMPDFEDGKWVYDCNRVKVVTISDRNSLTTTKPDNFNTHTINPMSGTISELVPKYLKEEHGVTVDDLKGSFPFRACVNGRYFQKVRNALPSYPWAFKEGSRRRLNSLVVKKVHREESVKVEKEHKAELYFVISSVHSKWIWAVDDIKQKEVLSSYYFVRKNVDRFKQFVKGERDESYKKFIGFCD